MITTAELLTLFSSSSAAVTHGVFLFSTAAKKMLLSVCGKNSKSQIKNLEHIEPLNKQQESFKGRTRGGNQECIYVACISGLPSLRQLLVTAAKFFTFNEFPSSAPLPPPTSIEAEKVSEREKKCRKFREENYRFSCNNYSSFSHTHYMPYSVSREAAKERKKQGGKKASSSANEMENFSVNKKGWCERAWLMCGMEKSSENVHKHKYLKAK